MFINKETLKQFGPCERGFDNFVTNYPEFSGSFIQLLDLPEIPYADKIWLAKKVLNKNQLIHFGLFCADSVLHIYESKYPNNSAPRDLLKYLSGIEDFSVVTQDEVSTIRVKRKAANAAALTADADAAYAAHAAAYAAYAADDADAAAYAVDAAYAAVDAAGAANARKTQQHKNIQLLKLAASL